MKKYLSIVGLAITLLFASCSKDTVTAPGNGGVEPSKKLIQTTVNGNQTMSYNADGTLKQINKATAGGNYIKTYTYAPGKVNYLGLFNGKKGEIGEYTLVNGKAVAFTWTYYDANENPIATFSETFSYNAKGLVDKHTYSNGDYALQVYDANDNMTSRTYYNNQGQALTKHEFVYGSQKDLFPYLGYFDSFGELFVVPPMSKYLPVSEKTTDLVLGQVTYQNSIVYQMDADGYVLKANVHIITGAYNDWEWTNTFQ